MSIRPCRFALIIPTLLVASLVSQCCLATEATTVLVRGEVIDAATRAPLPCRISIQGDDGAWHFPGSVALDGSAVIYNKHSLSDPNIVEMHTTLSAHPFQISLAPGQYTIVVERGKEYHAETRQVTVGDQPVQPDDPPPAMDRHGQARLVLGRDPFASRALASMPNLVLAEDLNVACPLTDWVREAFATPISRRKPSFRDPGPDPIKVDATHWIYPAQHRVRALHRRREGAHAGRLLRAQPQDAAGPGRAARPSDRRASPPRRGADRARQAQLALVDGARPDHAGRPVRAGEQPRLADEFGIHATSASRRPST